jgi:hypothetical protein
MADGYKIEHASLDKHEQDIRQVMEQVSSAVGTVREPFDVQAFGLVGSIWSAGLNAWITGHTGCVDSAVKAGNDVADSVKKMNENYKQNESNLAASFNAINTDNQGA